MSIYVDAFDESQTTQATCKRKEEGELLEYEVRWYHADGACSVCLALLLPNSSSASCHSDGASGPQRSEGILAWHWKPIKDLCNWFKKKIVTKSN